MSAIALMSMGSVAAAQDKPASDQVETIIVTGTRATTRTVTSSLAPIDVLPSTELTKSGKQSPRDLISTLVPSATTSNSGAGASFAVKTVSLRGLSADQTLVLVNGKRRHNTAILFVNGTTQNGQSPPDMDLIPVSSIDHIEVLRDGASAQYGSDALAGVINIILKKSPTHGSLSLLGGKNIDGGGLTEQGAGNIGLKIGEGALNLSVDLRENDYVNRGVPFTGRFFAAYAGGPATDPREATVDRNINHPGQPAIQLYSVSDDYEYPITDTVDLYAFGTLSSRYSRAWLTPRLPNQTANQILEVYPLGYSPQLRLIDHDLQQNFGVKGENLYGFTWDFSTSFSQDNVDFHEDSLNASYGPASPTRFYLGSMQAQESTTNLDLTRSVPTGFFAKPLFLAGGVEYRWDQLMIKKGDPASYLDGGYVATSGPDKGIVNQAGAQGVSGFGPLSAGTYARTNVSLYVNGEQSVLPNWDVSLAGRYEHYSDFGDAETYKVSTRYEPIPGFAVRGTVSSGFRAPSLQQEHYASASTIGVRLAGATTTSLYPVQLLPPNSAAAMALGATPLKPETSNNYSVGFVANPMPGLSVTLDLYQVDIQNRILQSASLGPAVAVSNVLASVGLNPQQAVFFYTNGADTSTQGLDLVAEYRKNFGDFGRFHWTISADLNHTKFLKVKAPPPSLAAAGLVLVDRARQGDFTLGNPREKFIFSTEWQIWKLDSTLRLNGYGSVVSVASVAAGGAASDETVSAAMTVDLDIAAKLTDNLTFSIGANNLFNRYSNIVRPADRGATMFTYTNQYSPFGIAGGFYYGRLSYSF
ncbi:MAG: TonB-dependent receptor plug domain-containing protein [Caulobacteraceae bacterium]